MVLKEPYEKRDGYCVEQTCKIDSEIVRTVPAIEIRLRDLDLLDTVTGMFGENRKIAGLLVLQYKTIEQRPREKPHPAAEIVEPGSGQAVRASESTRSRPVEQGVLYADPRGGNHVAALEFGRKRGKNVRLDLQIRGASSPACSSSHRLPHAASMSPRRDEAYV